MIPPKEFDHQIRQVFVPTDRGVVGLVDGLLAVCTQAGWLFALRSGASCVLTIRSGWDIRRYTGTPFDQPGVFRAALARLAVLCNQRIPDSVSPYGGDGQLVVPGAHPVVREVSFRNTPGEQWLTVSRPMAARGSVSRPVDTDARFSPTSGLVWTPSPASVG